MATDTSKLNALERILHRLNERYYAITEMGSKQYKIISVGYISVYLTL